NTLFSKWREKNQTAFLKEKRALEKKEGCYAKPYLDYLQVEERKQFEEFWKAHRSQVVKKMLVSHDDSSSLAKEFLSLRESLSHYSITECISLFNTMQSFDELEAALWGNYPYLRAFQGVKNKKSLAASFYPLNGFGYGRSFCFRQSCQLGSLFKIVPAYAALLQQYESHGNLDILTMVDAYQKNGSSYTMGTFANGETIPRMYKGGRLPRSEHSNVGRVNLSSALETSSNPYFSILALEHITNPDKFLEISSLFSFGHKTGVDLAGEIGGKLPQDLSQNMTGLFSFAIGQHAFDSTPLQASSMLSILANKGACLKPQILKIRAGKQPSYSAERLFNRSKYPFQKPLEAIGIDFPLFSATLTPLQESLVDKTEREITHQLPLPLPVYSHIISGLKQVVTGRRGTARHNKIHTYDQNSRVMNDYKALSEQFVGKTSTAQRVERIWPAKIGGGQMVKHIWFGGIFFEDESLKKPELVVIVYLRFGDFGREAAPLATQVASEWRRIKASS
ncbi:MAG: penicillin-binding transpeptidase domain-containing protein, partial [Chlamydiota bacterium]